MESTQTVAPAGKTINLKAQPRAGFPQIRDARRQYSAGIKNISVAHLWENWDMIPDSSLDGPGFRTPQEHSELDLAEITRAEFKRRRIKPPYLLSDIFENRSKPQAVRVGPFPDGTTVDTIAHGPPVFRIKTAGFGNFLADYAAHIKLSEASAKLALAKRPAREIAKASAAMLRYGFGQRARKILDRLILTPTRPGVVTPYLWAEPFKNGRAKMLFWDFSDLASREWLARSSPDTGGRNTGHDDKTAELHRAAEQEYRRELRLNPYESHAGRCAAVAQKMRSALRWNVSSRTLENLLRPLSRAASKKKARRR